MNDLFDLPAERELPDSVRAEARRRVVANIGRSTRTLGWAPIAVAAAVVLLALGAVTYGVTSGHSEYTPASGGDEPFPSENKFVTPEQMYSVKDHQAPPDASRCGPDGWQPILTASARGATVIVYRTIAGIRFCELTPTTVTLSAPVASGAAPGGVRATFVTQSGTVAGVLDPAFQAMQVGPGDRQTGRTLAVVRDGIFVAPNDLPLGSAGLHVTLGGSPDVMGGQRSIPASDVPSTVPATVDRRRPSADRKSSEGRRLADCFTRADHSRVVDPANWQATDSATLDEHESAQLGRYDNLLAVCVFTGNQVYLKIDEETDSNGFRDLEVGANKYLFTTTVFYDFRTHPSGAGESDTVAVTGLVKSGAVASVSLSRPESPAVIATVHNGTFILPDIYLNEGTPEERDRTVMTVFDATGAVLALLPIQI
jgi:hypothetical protein